MPTLAELGGWRGVLSELTAGRDLDADRARAAMDEILAGAATPAQIAGFIVALRMKGEAVTEVVAMVDAMLAAAAPIELPPGTDAVDIVGTGGAPSRRLHALNVSTMACFVAAGAGAKVCKHGNRKASSTSGSFDLLDALGVAVELDGSGVARCVDEVGIGFCFAPLFHSAMKNVAPVRKQLRFRTIFNLLGPLTNPARAEFQLIGASRRETAHRLARALAELGRQHAFVVCGADQLDEVSLWGMTTAFEVAGGHVIEQRWTVDSFGLPECRVEDLQVQSPAESAAIIGDVFAGRAGPARNIVLANAAAALMAALKAATPREGVEQAVAAIDSRKAREILERLVATTHNLSKA